MTSSYKNRVFALFDDGSADEILFSYFGAPQAQDIPIRAYSSDIHDLDVQRSVLDGASSALANYEKSYRSLGQRYCFAYKFQTDSTNQSVTGKSAGLAFCIKFALKVYAKLLIKDVHFSIAATGVIEIDEQETQIKTVERINKKIEAAADVLQKGDKFFYPLDNESQIDVKLIEELKKRGVSIHAVQNVAQVIQILFAGYLETGKPESKKAWVFILSSVILIILTYYSVFLNSEESCLDSVFRKLQSADYMTAKEMADKCLQESHNDSLQSILKKINSELKVAVNFVYIKNNESQNAVFDRDTPLLMGTDDGYRFEISSAVNCYVYIFQFDSKSTVERLFPLSAYVLNQHYLYSNQSIKIPGGENMFYLDDREHHGIVTTYIIAAYWRLIDIERMYNQYEDTQNSQVRRKLYNSLINHFKHYSEVSSKHFNSLFLKDLTFIQQ